MALPDLNIRSTASSSPGLKRKKRLTLADLGTGNQQRISAAKIAEGKGFKLSKLDDYAKEGGLAFVGALGDTLAYPQRQAGALLSGNGLIYPYGEEADTLNPSDLLVKGPDKLTGLAGFSADVLFDPLNVTGVKVLTNAPLRTAERAAAKEAEKLATEAAAAGAAETAKSTSQAAPKLPLSLAGDAADAGGMGIAKSIQDAAVSGTLPAPPAPKPPKTLLGWSFGKKTVEKMMKGGEEDVATAVEDALQNQPTIASDAANASDKVSRRQAELGQLQQDRASLDAAESETQAAARKSENQRRRQFTGTRQTLDTSTPQSWKTETPAGDSVRVPKSHADRVSQESGRGVQLSPEDLVKYGDQHQEALLAHEAGDSSLLDKAINAVKVKYASDLLKSDAANATAKGSQDVTGLRGKVDKIGQLADSEANVERGGRMAAESQAADNLKGSKVSVPKDTVVKDAETGAYRVESNPGVADVTPLERTREADALARGEAPLTEADLARSSMSVADARRTLDRARASHRETGRTPRQREVDIRKGEKDLSKAEASRDALLRRYAAQQAGPPNMVRGGKALASERGALTAERRGVQQEVKTGSQQAVRGSREAEKARAAAERAVDNSRKELAALQAAREGKTSYIPPSPKPTELARIREARKALDKKIAKKEKKLSAAERQAAQANDQRALDGAMPIEGASKAAIEELASQNPGTVIGLRLGGSMIPLAATTNETIAKGFKTAGKFAPANAVGKALNEAFNPAAGTNRSVYLAKRIMVHAGTAATERDMAFIDRTMEKVSPRNAQKVTDIFVRATDRPVIKGDNPEQWAQQIKDIGTDIQVSRYTLGLADSAPFLFEINKSAKKTLEKRIASLESDLQNLTEMKQLWDQLDEPSKNAYKQIRQWTNDKWAQGAAYGLFDKAPERANYIYTKKLNKEERRNRRQATAPGKAAFRNEKVSNQIPDDYDIFEWSRAYARDFNREVFSREFSRMVGYRFGIETAAFKSLPKAEQANFVEFKAGKDALGMRLYIPKDIEQSLKNLTSLGVDPNGESLLLRGFNDISSKWKALAYSNNFGHFLVDGIGDTWNTVLEHGVGIIPHVVKSLDRNGSFYVTEQFLKALDDGVQMDGIVKVRGKDMTLRDFGAMKVKVGKNSYRVDDLALGYLAAGNRNSGRAAGDVGNTPNTGKGNLQNKVSFGDKDYNAPRLYKAYTTSMQRLGNKRDNWSKRLALIAAISYGSSRGMGARAAAQFATRSVRKSLFDYSELTQFEKRIARNFIPFYTWTRKNVPYQARMAFERPGTAMAPYKLQQNLEDQNNPDYNTPDYLRTKSLRIGNLPQPIAKLIGQEKGKPFYLNPMLPSFDLGFLQNTTGGLDPSQGIGMLSPAVRLPLELSASKPRNFQTGEDISGSFFGNNGGIPFLGSKGEYVAETALGQPGRVVSRLTDGKLSKPERLMPLIGSQTGIRGQFVDPAKTRRGYEFMVRDKQQEQIKALQDAGLIPTYEEIAAMRQQQQGLDWSTGRGRKKRLSLADLGA